MIPRLESEVKLFLFLSYSFSLVTGFKSSQKASKNIYSEIKFILNSLTLQIILHSSPQLPEEVGSTSSFPTNVCI